MKHLGDIFRTMVLKRPALTPQQRAAIKELRALKAKLKISPQDGGTIKVTGTIELHHQDLVRLPDFSIVDLTGDLLVQGNRLSSLEGSPHRVSGTFNCCGNGITSLKGAPSFVGKDFFARGNRLATLEGGPDTVRGSYDCADNKLTSLKGAPERVPDNFSCQNNKLTSLERGPHSVTGDYVCSKNVLTSLIGAPLMVKSFTCDDNQLTSLEGGPTAAMGVYSCEKNPIDDFDAAPKVYLHFEFGGRTYNFPGLPDSPRRRPKPQPPEQREPAVELDAPIAVHKPIVFAKKGKAP